MHLLHAPNKKWATAQGYVFSYRLFPESRSSIFVVWEDSFLVPGYWTIWAHARSLDLAAPGQLGSTTDLFPGSGSGTGALFLQPKEWTPFLGTRLQSWM